MTPSDAWLRLALVSGLGPASAARLLEAAGDIRAVFDWSFAQLCAVDGIGGERARRICDPRGEELVAAERATCHGAGVRILTRDDPAYPRRLLDLTDPPLALWMTGTFEPRDALAVAVVGPRRPSAYGHRCARRLAGGLARIGACVVSGLARGIDTVAHEAALENGARTIAVIGSGFGRLYPEENRPLAERIAAAGAVVSELPFACPPSAGTFPRRNRVVAALSLATLVVEAGATSGALITARMSAELGRTVLVVPGAIDNPESAGANQLIRDGATLVSSVEHILEEVGPLMTLAAGSATPGEPAPNPRAEALSGREKQIYTLLDDQARSVDDVVRVAGLPPSAVSTTLLVLELRRLVRKVPGGFVRAT
jgi:DNA processing protein